jgi:hypothetical protein
VPAIIAATDHQTFADLGYRATLVHPNHPDRMKRAAQRHGCLEWVRQPDRLDGSAPKQDCREPQPMREQEIEPLGKLTIHAHSPDERGARVTLTNNAADFWAHVYQQLTQDFPGIYEVRTARTAVQVLRLALTCTLLDGPAIIALLNKLRGRSACREPFN